MRLLVKFGGSLLEHDDARRALAAQLAEVRDGRRQLVVVHGGGKQMTRYLAERGVESRFVNGLRVTTPEVVDAILKVFAGSVNRELVASMIAGGLPAVGLSGIDGCLVEAEQLDPELGAVGRPVRANTAVLEALVERDFLPVVACVAGDRQGRVFNVNADQMAVACAAAFRADRLLFLTDVDGVRDANGAVLPEMDIAAGERLIAAGVATGGMQAKLNAAHQALRDGVPEVVIAPGAAANVIPRLLGGERLGTRITA